MVSRIIIKVSAERLATAYFNGRISGTIRAPAGLTSHGREVRFISISKGARRITLTGKVANRQWEETYPASGADLDD